MSGEPKQPSVGEQIIEGLQEAVSHEPKYLRDALNDILTALKNPHQDNYYNKSIACMIAEGALNGTWGRNDGTEIMLHEGIMDKFDEAFKKLGQGEHGDDYWGPWPPSTPRKKAP